MFFPASLKKEKVQSELPEDIILPKGARIQFTSSCKYLGSFIDPFFNDDLEIDTRIKKAKSILGYSKHFFDSKNVDQCLKA
jgi:hypothetical protein